VRNATFRHWPSTDEAAVAVHRSTWPPTKANGKYSGSGDPSRPLAAATDDSCAVPALDPDTQVSSGFWRFCWFRSCLNH
jgi:hypothetical protein